MTRWQVINGDNQIELPKLADNSIDAIVTDPPYELGFMGKSWDATGIAYNVNLWRECLRVLKPGGHILAFSGSRTYHRMAVAIEDAGFEIRDQIMWVYGSGFPKSLDIGKAIDKVNGYWRGRAGEISSENGSMSGANYQRTDKGDPITAAAAAWNGWGTALKPAHEPIVLARKPLVGTVANNVLTRGVGGLNIDACRVGNDGGTKRDGKADKPNNAGWENMRGHKIAELEAGRWPANFIHDGSDDVLELFPDTGKSTGGRIGKKSMGNVTNVPAGQFEAGDPGYGDSGSAARFFYCAKANKTDRNEGLDDFTPQREADRPHDNLPGGDNPRNRTNTPRLNHHPTVKPTNLMRYLCRLITPPNGIILDPFTGSGSTGKAAILEGFQFIGIEQDPTYTHIAQTRIQHTESTLT